MENIFSREEEVISQAETILSSESNQNNIEADEYRLLLKEYKTLLRQMKRIVRMSDKTQQELKRLMDKLDQLSSIDALTGLYNRRHFNEIYVKEWRSSIRNQKELSIIMLDIDYFKKYNDTYGHLQGDECLKEVAKVISKAARRPRDLVARFGGEEFVVLLPETGLKGAVNTAEMILQEVEELGLEHKASPARDTVTLSLGIASAVAHPETPKEDLINNSDQALYQAKNSGRNRYMLYKA